MRAVGVRVALAATVLVSVLFAVPPATAAVGDMTEWATPTPGSSPQGIAVGSDGALWFVERGADKIGRITTLGVATEYALPNGGGPTGIALGPDGAMWFTEQAGNRIGRISASGVVTEFLVPTPLSSPTGIALGPDGAMWFTERRTNRIGRITTDGSITELALSGGPQPTGIVSGPDGAIWFTAPGTNSIGRITSSGVVTYVAVPTPSSGPTGITLGPDGAVWFTEQGAGKIARMGSDTSVVEHPTPTTYSGPHGISGGPDGNVWFAASAVSMIGRLTLVPPDGIAPTVELAEPVDGAVYVLGQVAHASYTCADEGGSGLISCSGTLANGARLDTSVPAIQSFEVVATDGVGNSTAVAHTYVVAASWDGRLLPPPLVATLRAGQPADLRFDTTGLGATVSTPPTTQVVDCSTGSPTSVLEPAEPVGPGLHVSGDRVTFRWRTHRTWAGTCRHLVLTLTDGTTLRLTARFV